MRRVSLAIALVALCALAGAGSAAARMPPIKHVFVIVLENKDYDETFGHNSAAPYLSLTLPKLGALLPNYYGIGHDSNDNYLAMVSGQGPNVETQADCQSYNDLNLGFQRQTVSTSAKAVYTRERWRPSPTSSRNVASLGRHTSKA